jgi:hypothetical protein
MPEHQNLWSLLTVRPAILAKRKMQTEANSLFIRFKVNIMKRTLMDEAKK